MAWTTPRTWVDDELVTDTMMNAHVRDNLNHLHEMTLNLGSNSVARSTSTTTTSTSYATVSSMSASITKNSSNTVIIATLYAHASITNYQSVYLRLYDATNSAVLGNEIRLNASTGASQHAGQTIITKTSALSAGSYTFRVEWKVSGGTGTFYAGELFLTEATV